MIPTPAALHPRTERRLAAAGRIRDLLRSAIMHGEIPSGVLPAENDLMRTFSASRQVIRDAIELLREEGLVRRLQGTGTLVTSTRLYHDFDTLRGPEQPIEHHILQIGEEPAPPSVARNLGLPAGASCGVVEVLTILGDAPLHIALTYVHPWFLQYAQALGPQDDWFELYARAGVPIGSTAHAIEASVADTYNAALLGVDVGHPVLVLERLVHDASGTPLEFAFTRIRGDRITLHQRMQGNGSPSP